MALPEFAVPDARTGPLDQDANIYQDDCSTSENPCPAEPGATPACEIDARGRDPRLRPLRPSAGDLVLVHARRRLPADPGRRRPGRLPLPWPRELPLDRHPRRSGRRAPDRRRAGLEDPGRLRPRRRGQRPLPGGRMPDGGLRLPRRDPRRSRRSAPRSSRSRSSPSDVQRLLRESRAARAARTADGRGGRSRGGLGRARAARGVPGPRPALPADRAAARAAPRAR